MRIVKPIVFLVLFINSFTGFSATFEDGILAYNEENYLLAEQKFDSIVQQFPRDIGALYNLGLSAIENKSYGKAIWAFERILKFHPNDTEVKDKIRASYFQLYPNFYWEFRLNGFQSILYSISPNTWGVIVVFSAISIALMILLFMRNKKSSIRRIAFFSGFFFLLLFFFSMATGYFTKQYQTANNRAIVITKSVASIKNQEEINEGQVVECQECDGDTIVFTTKNKQEIMLLRQDVRFI